MRRIEIHLDLATFQENVDMIVSTLLVAFSKSNNTLPFKDRVVKMLPEIEGRVGEESTQEEIKRTVESILKSRYTFEKDFIQTSIKEKSCLLNQQVLPCAEEMFQIFSLQCPDYFKVKCYVGYFNPFPRDVIKRNYYIHYKVKDDIFVRASLHEINHMILFEKWKSMHGYKGNEQPEFPSPLWYLEELSIEPTLNKKSILRIAPYRHETYDSFYQTIIEGKPLPEIIHGIYSESNTIEQYLDKAYCFLEKSIHMGLINI